MPGKLASPVTAHAIYTRDKFMLRSIKQLYGDKLGTSDGEIGHVKDFYFDDQNWAIRYLIADTGSWLSGRQVLISPHHLGSLDQAGKVLRVNLTRKQIENCPSIESHKPVSRQYEEEYYRYYGWPYYWQGDGLWGMSGFPILELPAKPLPSKPATASGPQRIVQLGGIAEGTVRVAASRTRLPEYPLAIAEGMADVEAVARALSTFGQEARATIDEANALDDADTADLVHRGFARHR